MLTYGALRKVALNKASSIEWDLRRGERKKGESQGKGEWIESGRREIDQFGNYLACWL